MANKQLTTRIWEKTVKNLRMIYALTGVSMVEILDRLVEQELQRVQQEQKPDDPKSL